MNKLLRVARFVLLAASFTSLALAEEYKVVGNQVQRSDGAWIPSDPDNRDWQKYQKWLSEGHVPTVAQQPAPQDEAKQKRNAVLSDPNVPQSIKDWIREQFGQ